MFSCEYCQIFKNTYFEEHMRWAVSVWSVFPNLWTELKNMQTVLIAFPPSSVHIQHHTYQVKFQIIDILMQWITGTRSLSLRKPLWQSQSNVNSSKKTCWRLFLYLSVQIETENYKLIYESQFRDFIKCGKICITFGTFYDQLWPILTNSKRPENVLVIFDFSLLEWGVVKNRTAIFGYAFTFWDIGHYYIFVSFEISTKNTKFFVT